MVYCECFEIKEWIKYKLHCLYYSLYKRTHTPEETCEKFGHVMIYPDNMGSMPPMKCFCKCCHKRFLIDYPVDFIKRGVEYNEVVEFSNPNLTDEYILKNWY